MPSVLLMKIFTCSTESSHLPFDLMFKFTKQTSRDGNCNTFPHRQVHSRVLVPKALKGRNSPTTDTPSPSCSQVMLGPITTFPSFVHYTKLKTAADVIVCLPSLNVHNARNGLPYIMPSSSLASSRPVPGTLEWH